MHFAILFYLYFHCVLSFCSPRSSSSEPETTDNNNQEKEAEFSDALPTLNHNDSAAYNGQGDAPNGTPSGNRELSQISEHGGSSLPRSANFFNTMGSSFIHMVGTLDDGVNTKNFTACAAELARIFGKDSLHLNVISLNLVTSHVHAFSGA